VFARPDFGSVWAGKTHLSMASTANLSHRSMLRTLPASGCEMLRISAKRLMVRVASIGTVLTKVINDSPLPEQQQLGLARLLDN